MMHVLSSWFSMKMSCHGDAVCITGPLWGESTGHQWIPLTKGQLCRTFDIFFVVSLNELSWHGNALCITGPLWGESTGHQWIPLTKGQLCRTFDVFFVVSLNELLNQQSSHWWFEVSLHLSDIFVMGERWTTVTEQHSQQDTRLINGFAAQNPNLLFYDLTTILKSFSWFTTNFADYSKSSHFDITKQNLGIWIWGQNHSNGEEKKSRGQSSCERGHAALVAITGTTTLVPYHLGKSLNSSEGGVPVESIHQVSCSDLPKMIGYQDDNPSNCHQVAP